MESKGKKFLKEEFILAVNTLLLMAKEKDINLGKTQLQKLLYLWYRACLRDQESNNPFRDKKDVFSAWNYGPVIPKVMYYFTNNPVGFIYNESGKFVSYAMDQEQPRGKKMIEHLDYVLNEYGNYSAMYLTAITHSEGSPYAKTINQYGPYQKIKDEYIKDNDGRARK